jgi:hypothetical protein
MGVLASAERVAPRGQKSSSRLRFLVNPRGPFPAAVDLPRREPRGSLRRVPERNLIVER